MPSYAIEEEGPDHAKRFTATVSVAGTAYGSGKGRSKKEAEQQAAREAFEALAAKRMVTGTGDDGTDPPGHPPGGAPRPTGAPLRGSPDPSGRTPPVEVVPADRPHPGPPAGD
jgi:ribosomal protein S12 methylthiotransferase accessory factor YcaO